VRIAVVGLCMCATSVLLMVVAAVNEFAAVRGELASFQRCCIVEAAVSPDACARVGCDLPSYYCWQHWNLREEMKANAAVLYPAAEPPYPYSAAEEIEHRRLDEALGRTPRCRPVWDWRSNE
jgi:hypothetical protein